MASPDDTPKNRQGFTTNVPAKKPAASPTISASDSSGRGFTLGIIALVIVGLGGIAFLATQRDSDISDAPQIAAVDVSGPALEAFPRDVGAVTSAATDSAVGVVAPTLVGTEFDGTEVRIEPDGRNKAVYFLAHWCPNCQEEVPSVQGLIDAGNLPDNVDVYAVSTSVDDRPNRNYPPELWLNREGWTAPTMRDDETGLAFRAYGGTGFPYVVYLDGENRVVTRSSGTLQAPVTLSIWDNLASGSLVEAVEGDDGGVSELDDNELIPTEDSEEPAE